MDDSSKMIIRDKMGTRNRREVKKEDLELHRGEFSMFSEKMAGLVGPSYFLAFMAGGITGMVQRPPLKARRTHRLLLNSVVNNTMKTGFRYANNTGAAVLLYLLTGKFIVFILKEEFED